MDSHLDTTRSIPGWIQVLVIANPLRLLLISLSLLGCNLL